jgi:hypothetical protein
MARISIAHALVALLAASAPLAPAWAQSVPYTPPSERDRGDDGETRRRETVFTPYIEVSQVVTTRNIPQNETFTYTRAAAGVDMSVAGQRNGGAMSLRYERRFDWNQSDAAGDAISGLANGYATVTPGLQFHAGGLATRERFNASGASVPGAQFDDEVVQVYSLYAGPVVKTRAGDVELNASYRIGYSRVEQETPRLGLADDPAPLIPVQDIFEDSTVHAASLSAAVKPGEVLPVGVGVSSTYYREDITNLDQRIEDAQARATVTIPVAQSVALSGAVGYEKVQISGRDAVIGADGLPLIGKGGNYVTDKSAPRVLAYDVDGLIWDVGVMWRPSQRTALTANVGRRYGSTSYTGQISYRPSERMAVHLAVYDNVAGFGGQLNRTLAELPTDFTVNRNAFTGNIGGCVSSLESGGCLSGALGTLRSAAFRARGVAASYGLRMGRISAGLSGGLDRRRFIAAPGTILETVNGQVDENYWLNAYVNAQFRDNSSLETNLYANWVDSGGTFSGDTKAYGASAAYYRDLARNLSARAALGIEGLTEPDLPEDYWTASALVGLRYSF